MFGVEIADVPFLKGYADIYRVSLISGKSIDVQEDHLFITPHGWKQARLLRVGDVIGSLHASDASHLRSNLDTSQSVFPEDAYHWNQTIEGSPVYCQKGYHFCDEPPHRVSNNVQSLIPSPTSVATPDCDDSFLGDPVGRSGFHHVSHAKSRHSTLDCDVPSSSKGCTGFDTSGLPFLRTFSCNQNAYPFLSLTSQVNTIHEVYPNDLASDDHSLGSSHHLHHESLPFEYPLMAHMEQIEAIKVISRNQPYYDLTVPKAHHYLAGGIWNHNTSKTSSILEWLVSKAMRHPGCRILICRNHRSDLTNSVIPTLEDEVLPRFGFTEPPGGRINRAHRTEYLIGNGSAQSVIALKGVDADGASSLLSSAWSFVYAAEAVEIDFEILKKLDGCMRYTKSKQFPMLPEIAQVVVDCNPVAPSHPLNKKGEDCPDELRIVRTREDYARLYRYNMAPAKDPIKRWKRIVTRVMDNPGYWDWDSWGFTAQGRNYYETRLKGYEGSFQFDRWYLGLWRSAEGNVFTNFRREAHVIEPFDVPKDWPIYCFWDPGMDHPTGISFIAVAPNGDYFIIDEIYQSGQTCQEHAATLRAKNKAKGRVVTQFYGDPYGAFRQVAEAPMSIQEQLSEVGIDLEPWPRASGADVTAGVNLMRERLSRSRDGADGGLYIFNTCENTISEFENWKYKRKADGSQPLGDDAYVDAFNDLLDGIRGAVVLNLQYDGSVNCFFSRRE